MAFKAAGTVDEVVERESEGVWGEHCLFGDGEIPARGPGPEGKGDVAMAIDSMSGGSPYKVDWDNEIDPCQSEYGQLRGEMEKI